MIDKIVQIAEDLGWSVDVSEEELLFGKFSPEGQDFSFPINKEDFDDITWAIHNYIDNFDISEEVYLWLDNTGHGKNGAPYDMKDLYEDFEASLENVDELLKALLAVE